MCWLLFTVYPACMIIPWLIIVKVVISEDHLMKVYI
jgi:hypothetical protein